MDFAQPLNPGMSDDALEDLLGTDLARDSLGEMFRGRVLTARDLQVARHAIRAANDRHADIARRSKCK